MDEFEFPVELVRTNRKRFVSLQVIRLKDGVGVRILAPQASLDDKIRDIIVARYAWIMRQIKIMKARPLIKPKEYVNGERFSYLGRTYRLKIIAGPQTSLKLKQGYFEAVISARKSNRPPAVKSLIVAWYKHKALIHLKERTEHYANIIGVTFQSVGVKTYKARWGSCSPRAEISYNWQIMLAPQKIVDYVVVHELCHLLEHNHSPKYWAYVKSHLSDYKQRHSWLRANARSLLV